jgi:hypothetical protein
MSERPADQGELRNPDVRREETDVDTKAIMSFVAALAAGIVVVMLAMWGLFLRFWHEEEEKKKSTYPLAIREREQSPLEDRLPPSPRIEGLGQTKPEHSVGRINSGTAQVLIQAQEAELNSYGWANAERTVARIPIEEAIERLAKPDALLARKEGRPVDRYLSEPSETSSGRRARGQQP